MMPQSLTDKDAIYFDNPHISTAAKREMKAHCELVESKQVSSNYSIGKKL
jgi:hypothetical protein